MLHEEIKENIYNQLEAQFYGTNVMIGTENPTGHSTSVDLVVNDPANGLIFYEFKTEGSALSCIREALGQIIEYSYYPTNQHATTLILVFSSHPVDIYIRLYMRHQRKIMGIKIYYRQYSITTKILEVPLV